MKKKISGLESGFENLKKLNFQGFSSPNYTQVPDELFDLLMPDLHGSALKVLLYITRRTFGFKKNSDRISLKQMVEGIKTKDGRILDRGTGLSKPQVISAIKTLKELNIIKVERKSSPEKGDEVTTYSLILLTHKKIDAPGLKNLTPPSKKTLLPGVKKFNPQYTVLQETDNTVNVTETEFKPQEDEEFRTEALVEDILEVTKDKRSKGFYRKVVRKCPDAMIYRALSEVKDTDRMGKIRKSKGAYFTSLIQKYSEEQGITI